MEQAAANLQSTCLVLHNTTETVIVVPHQENSRLLPHADSHFSRMFVHCDMLLACPRCTTVIAGTAPMVFPWFLVEPFLHSRVLVLFVLLVP